MRGDRFCLFALIKFGGARTVNTNHMNQLLLRERAQLVGVNRLNLARSGSRQNWKPGIQEKTGNDANLLGSWFPDFFFNRYVPVWVHAAAKAHP
jgi:hypothetical protein